MVISVMSLKPGQVFTLSRYQADGVLHDCDTFECVYVQMFGAQIRRQRDGKQFTADFETMVEIDVPSNSPQSESEVEPVCTSEPLGIPVEAPMSAPAVVA